MATAGSESHFLGIGPREPSEHDVCVMPSCRPKAGCDLYSGQCRECVWKVTLERFPAAANSAAAAAAAASAASAATTTTAVAAVAAAAAAGARAAAVAAATAAAAAATVQAAAVAAAAAAIAPGLLLLRLLLLLLLVVVLLLHIQQLSRRGTCSEASQVSGALLTRLPKYRPHVLIRRAWLN